MIDFTNCIKNKLKAYGGKNGNKLAIKYNDEDYMLKFPIKNKKESSYTNCVFSEYISCKIIKSMGFNVQEVLLGKYLVNNEYKLAVACKDFTDNNKVLKEFSFFKNKEFGTSGYSTDLNEVLNTIQNQDIYDKEELTKFFWDMFVIDAFLGNFDRHNGNWGFLIDNIREEVSIAPIYDCASCLYPAITDEMMEEIVNNPDEMKKRVFVFPNSALKINDNKINYYEIINSLEYKDLNDALLRVYPRVDIEKINNIIDNVEGLDNNRKLFYKAILFIRYEIILTDAYNKLNKKN